MYVLSETFFTRKSKLAFSKKAESAAKPLWKSILKKTFLRPNSVAKRTTSSI
jgi:hypothetical protein